MKHPLTSKERRGLVAVAAAALLCIGSGFAFRSCRSHAPVAAVVIVDDRDSVISESSGKSEKSGDGKRARRAKRNTSGKKTRQEKTYPSRSPLDEPIGQ